MSARQHLVFPSASLALVPRLHALPVLAAEASRLPGQVENAKLTDYEGTYARFLEKNVEEAAVMAAKDQKKRELDKSQIKAKSKVHTFSNCFQ